MLQLPSHIHCTACGACVAKCPKRCITMQDDESGAIYPHIDTNTCLKCHTCEKVCPILAPVSLYKPYECYAAWNKDPIERKTSASGGIAIALYHEALRQGYACVGAKQNDDWSVSHCIATDKTQLQPFKNSKYVFSSALFAYTEVKTLLMHGSKVIMIALPCQIAAMRKLFGNNDNLLLVDIVCHGSVPTTYLQQHIIKLEKEHRKKAYSMSFRAPEKGTATYHFTLYDKNKNIFYSKRTLDGDTYNYGFHRAVSYRENCYHCRFARPERVSDITLGDFHGLGTVAPCNYDETEVSTILINTTKGENFISEVIKNGAIHAELRPVEESLNGDKQLQSPSSKSHAREDFEKLILTYKGDYEKTIVAIIKNIKRRELKQRVKNKIKRLLHL